MIKAQYKDLMITEIDAGDRLRGLSKAHVEAIASSIEEHGQQTPILVREKDGGYKLIAGCHRMAAIGYLKKKIVNCKIYSGVSDEKARLLEIDENLFRHDLNALDRAVFLAERKAIYEEMYPEAMNGAQGGRGGKKNESEIVSFSKDTAEKLGMSPRAIERAVRIATKISPELRSRLHEAEYIKEGELYNLTKFASDDQGKIIDLVLSDKSPASNVKDAASILSGSSPTPLTADEKQFNKLMDIWSRTEAKARKRFLDSLEAVI